MASVKVIMEAVANKKIAYKPRFCLEGLKTFKKEALEAIIYYIEEEAHIHGKTDISNVIQEMLIGYHNYLKEYHLN